MRQKKTNRNSPWRYLQILIPILLVVILYHVIPMFDLNFRDYVNNNTSDTVSHDNTINEEKLSALTQRLQHLFNTIPHPIPQKIQDTILQTPLKFLKNLNTVLKYTPEDILLLVDKTHAISESYIPNDLVPLNTYKDRLTLNKDTLMVRSIIINDLLAMVRDAAKEHIVLDISSTYRSYAYQQAVFKRNVAQLGQQEALRQSARPGTSQHQLGLTIDFGSITPAFAHTPAGMWLAENAWKYGFSLSYPATQESITGYMYESWHFRYLGISATTFEKTYFGQGQQYLLEIISKKDLLEELIEQYLGRK